jgi:hypothetical protein
MQNPGLAMSRARRPIGSGRLWNSKSKGESHNHRPSPCFDFVDFDLRREIGLTALKFFSGFRVTRRDP